jgi:hypothetical protein
MADPEKGHHPSWPEGTVDYQIPLLLENQENLALIALRHGLNQGMAAN